MVNFQFVYITHCKTSNYDLTFHPFIYPNEVEGSI